MTSRCPAFSADTLFNHLLEKAQLQAGPDFSLCLLPNQNMVSHYTTLPKWEGCLSCLLSPSSHAVLPLHALLTVLGQLGFCGHKGSPLQLTWAKRDFGEKPSAAHGMDFEAREKDLERARNQGRNRGRNTPRAKTTWGGGTELQTVSASLSLCSIFVPTEGAPGWPSLGSACSWPGKAW